MNLVYRFFSPFHVLLGGKYSWLDWFSWDIDMQHQKKGGIFCSSDAI
jgi:hypothetical protein